MDHTKTHKTHGDYRPNSELLHRQINVAQSDNHNFFTNMLNGAFIEKDVTLLDKQNIAYAEYISELKDEILKQGSEIDELLHLKVQVENPGPIRQHHEKEILEYAHAYANYRDRISFWSKLKHPFSKPPKPPTIPGDLLNPPKVALGNLTPEKLNIYNQQPSPPPIHPQQQQQQQSNGINVSPDFLGGVLRKALF